VANLWGQSVTEYPLQGAGDLSPIRSIAALPPAPPGSNGNNQLSFPIGVVVDGAGTLYVANLGENYITEYPAGANGDPTPIRRIGPGLGTAGARFLALDSAGNLYVSGGGGIAEFAYGAMPGDLPVRMISGPDTGLADPYGLAVGDDGTIYVANNSGNTITEYGPGANGDVQPVRTISGPSTGLNSPYGLAVDDAGTIFVANYGAKTVTEYAAGANGDASPIRTISGPSTGLEGPFGIALGSSGTLYVTNNSLTPDGVATVTEYAAGAGGDVSPIRTISGPTTGLSSPTGIAVLAAPQPVSTTVMTLTSSSFEPVVGRPLTFTAKVVPRPAGGTVTFDTGSGEVCAGVPVINGKATCTVTYDSPTFTCPGAIYNGSAGFGMSVGSTCLSVKYRTTTRVRSSANPATAGQAVTYTAIVRPVPDGGTVWFTKNGTIIPGCEAVAVVDGKAGCTLSKVHVSHVITATYGGDASHWSSAGSITETVL
jgi:sugar lactone lactonase YvrE